MALALDFRAGPCVKVMLLVRSVYVNAGSVFWAPGKLWKFSSVGMNAGLPGIGGVEGDFSLLNSLSVWFRCWFRWLNSVTALAVFPQYRAKE